MKELKDFLGLNDIFSKQIRIGLGLFIGLAILASLLFSDGDFATPRDSRLAQPDPGRVVWYFDFNTETYHYMDEKEKLYPQSPSRSVQQSPSGTTSAEERRLIRKYTKDPRERRTLIKLMELQKSQQVEIDIESEIDMALD